MTSVACPACGAQVQFRSSIAAYAVCPYCQSMLVRRDLDVESIGKMATLPSDATPLQIGTQGVYKGSGFQLVGRVHVKWSDGSWNEWFAFFDDGRGGWLAEAQGFYMVSFETEPDHPIEPRANLWPEKSLTFQGKNYEVADIKECTCAASEGELPYPVPADDPKTSVDLSSTDSSFANIEYSKRGTKLFIGSYVEFNDFKFNGLRQLEGW